MHILLHEPGVGTLTTADLPGSISQARALIAISRCDEAQAGRRLHMDAGLTVSPSTLAALSNRMLIAPTISAWKITPLGRLAVAWLTAVDVVGR